MSIRFTTRGRIQQALEALEEEDADLRKQIAALSERSEAIQASITSLRLLVGPPDSPPNPESKPVFVPRNTSKWLADSTLSVADAIEAFIRRAGIPQSAPQIGRGMLEAGFQTESQDFVNLVGTTLRRSPERFRRDEAGKWDLIAPQVRQAIPV